MALESPAYVISASSHSAELFRRTAQTGLYGTGVVATPGLTGLQVQQNGTPNMSVNVIAGMVWIPGTLGATAGMQTNGASQTAYGLPATFTSQGSYCAYQDGTVNLGIAAADPTNPRIDIICASIQDAQYAGSNNQAVLQVVTGTPAPSPSPPSPPASSVILAKVSVAAAATSVVTANITDQRAMIVTPGSQPTFLASQNTAQSIPNGTTTNIALDTITIDTYSGWNASNHWYTIPLPGAWLVSGQVSWAANPTGVRIAGLSSGALESRIAANAAAGWATTQGFSGIAYYSSAGAAVALNGYQGSGAALSTAGGYICQYSLTWLHP